MASPDFFEIRDLHMRFAGVQALQGVSISVAKNELLAVIGPNGAGKTTTLKSIMQILEDDDQPEKGSIEFLGKRIDRKDTEEIVRMGISYVPEGREVFPELTVLENIQMGAYTRKDRREIKKDIEDVFRHFPILRERQKQEAGYMSGASSRCWPSGGL